MDSTIINNWFSGELVEPDDMFDVNTQLLSTLFSSNVPGNVFGIVPTIDTGTMTFATTEGFAFFGVTTDTDYITNTGSTTLGCTVEAQNSLSLVDLDCYIYIQPVITLITGTRYTEVTGECYSSTNASDVGIKICDVIAGVATNFYNNNISNYFNLDNTALNLQNPDGTPLNAIFCRDEGRGGINISTVAGVPTSSYIGSGNTGAGGANGLVFDDELSSPYLNNWAAQVGDTDNSVATLGAVKRGNPSQSFTFGNWVIQVSGSGSYPADPSTTGLYISGTLNNATITNGGGNFSLDLASDVPVLTGAISGTRAGPASIANGYNVSSTIGMSCSMSSSTFLSINKANLGGTVTSAITFCIVI